MPYRQSTTSQASIDFCKPSQHLPPHAGSLNDYSIDKYSQIEAVSSISQVSQGQSIMQKHWKITKVRNIVNDFPHPMFCIIQQSNIEFGDCVRENVDRMF